MTQTKYVYEFSEGDASMKNLLGGKGANLAEMTGLGMPVPQGFTITTEACTQYYLDGETINDGIRAEILDYVTKLEAMTGKKFGDPTNPLLVSVRSGSRASMPGMMDTILNLGMNEAVVEAFATKTGNPRFVYDSYRRFIQMYSDVVMEVGKSYFEELIDEMKHSRNVKNDLELTADDLKELAAQFKAEYKGKIGSDFPSDPVEQLMGAIKAVFRSWDNPRAVYYRRLNDIPSDWGTAVNVQSMVFGNLGDTSGTGVAFSRNPATGDKGLYGEFLMNAQGEDVVAGIRTPETIDQLKEKNAAVYDQFVSIVDRLENHYRDMQDMEFTIEDGTLYMLQTRNGKRTAAAAFKIACDLVDEGQITTDQAVSMIDPKQIDALLHPQFDAAGLKAATPIGKGLPASPGAACGKVTFTAEDAAVRGKKGEAVILVRLETTPEDIEGMHHAQGILTARGGMTSHAAVVARGMGTWRWLAAWPPVVTPPGYGGCWNSRTPDSTCPTIACSSRSNWCSQAGTRSLPGCGRTSTPPSPISVTGWMSRAATPCVSGARATTRSSRCVSTSLVTSSRRPPSPTTDARARARRPGVRPG